MGTLQQQSIIKGHHVVRKPEESVLQDLFEIAASKNAEKTAIIYEDESGNEQRTTYKELDATTNQQARALRRMCKPQKDADNFVAVSMRPNDRLPTLLLSIVKSGMAYLPLDVEYPANRVKHILNESEPLLVVIEKDADALLYESTPVITYEELLEKSKHECEENVGLQYKPEDLVIILYTSGSTGIPKGVKLSNATLMNRLHWQWRELPYASDEDRCIFKTALTFVDHASEIWGPFLQGKTIVVVPKSVTKDPERFVKVLEKHKIQRLVLVPSLLHSLLMYFSLQDNDEVLASMRLWVCSGEVLSLTLAKKFFEKFSNGEHMLANFYGSTEIMGDVTYHLLNSAAQLEVLEKVPIGRPMDNCVVYLMDKDMRVVPQGEIGELMIAGGNLASGYIRGRDPHKFVDNPYTVDLAYSRLFLTGDYAKIVKGTIFYEGRLDSQIKIRGHRVDITEVEKTVITSPVVSKAVMLCYKPGELNQALLAFVTLKDDSVSHAQEIEEYLQSKLPPYMVPQVVVINKIPLLINGKTDRQYLLKFYEESNNNECFDLTNIDYTNVPEQDLDKATVLFSTIASVIGTSIRAPITIDSNFYQLGGNSLNSIYTVTKLRDQGYQIGISDFLTAKDMGVVLKRMQISKDDNCNDSVNSEDYIVEELNNGHQEEVIQMITESFYSKADLEHWILPMIKRSDYSELMTKLWEPLIEKGFSFVIKSRENEIIGVALNFDARDEPEVAIDSKLTIIFDFLEYLEGPIRDNVLPKGQNKILHSFMMATKDKMSPAENVILMKVMEEQCLQLARRKQFAGIFTTNTSPLTQQLGTDVFHYKVMLDYQVNKYVAEDGSKPFAEASNDQRAVCSWKEV